MGKQVYAALYDDNGLVLIAKKREFNDWWGVQGGIKRSFNRSLVNQAGQWCLPGGKQEKQDTTFAAAKREFLEETGFPFPFYSDMNSIDRNGYALVMFKVVNVLALADKINAGLQPDASTRAPTNTAIRDWELAEVTAVHATAIKNFLGRHIAVGSEAAAAVPGARKYSQDIDWYAQIADYLSSTLRF
jgi:ADP-ribose pyrophosphatase YjhB (NUDIX family)